MALDLERALEELATSLEFPAASDLADRVVAELERPAPPVPLSRRPAVRRVAALAAAAILVVAIVLGTSPRARRAVADLLGIGSVEIRRGTIPTSVPITFPTTTGPAAPTTPATPAPAAEVDAAAATLGIPPPHSAALGPPSSVTLDPGRLTLEWATSAALPPTGLPGVGALLTVVRAQFDEGLIAKVLEPGTTYERVLVGGQPGVWLAGQPHMVMYRTESGEAVPETLRLAGNTLIWTVGPFTYRLESALDRDAAIAVASSLGTA